MQNQAGAGETAQKTLASGAESQGPDSFPDRRYLAQERCLLGAGGRKEYFLPLICAEMWTISDTRPLWKLISSVSSTLIHMALLDVPRKVPPFQRKMTRL